jgi:hypothetical protein
VTETYQGYDNYKYLAEHFIKMEQGSRLGTFLMGAEAVELQRLPNYVPHELQYSVQKDTLGGMQGG